MPSYGTDQGLIDYLAETGRVLPADAVPAQVRAMGTMYVDGFEDLFCGVALTDLNSFPRDLWPTVPTRIEYAAYEAGFAYANGDPIFGGGGTAGGQIIKEKIDVLEIGYAAPTNGDWWFNNRYIVPLAYAHLLPFLCLPSDDDGACKGGMGAMIF